MLDTKHSDMFVGKYRQTYPELHIRLPRHLRLSLHLDLTLILNVNLLLSLYREMLAKS
jgi:hypothetical protein